MTQFHSITLSVVSIGRNEALNLPKHIESLKQLVSLGLKCEFIFVDSNSSDDSRNIAKNFFNRVLLIKEAEGNLSASLGRKIGTEYASAPWILYLDSDFELHLNFCKYLKNNLHELDQFTGYTGMYDYYVGDSHLLTNVQRYSSKVIEKISSIGGGILLYRETVLNAGNWSANLVANEEVDLQVRLEKIGCYIYSVPTNFIIHHTPSHSLFDKIFGNICPVGSYLGRKFYGPGQALVQAFKGGYFFRLILKRSEIYITSSVEFLAIIISLWRPYAILLVFLPLVLMVPRHGLKRSIAFSLHLPQIILGIFRYKTVEGIEVEIKEV
jgi:glycosyltransferase involved in cell wall biosynthesis